MSKILLSGNEAIARGAWEAGCDAGFGYPGTPSTETLESFSKLEGVYAEWAINEKVALESAIGFSMAGHRALVTMKHVGVNVASDPLMSIAYAGVNGGLVILAADDPGMFSSQNEQDSRVYAEFAKIPLFEPADSEEALEMTKAAFELSEKLKTIVMIRSTVRISHTKTLVETHDRQAAQPVPYQTSIPDWVMMPAYARPKRLESDKRFAELEECSETSLFNHAEIRDTSIGFIASGACYQYVREAFPEASTLKLGMTHPLPESKIRAFADSVDELYVVDEAYPYLLKGVRAFGIEPTPWTSPLPAAFEMSAMLLKESYGSPIEQNTTALELQKQVAVPPRPPALCAGCPHRVAFNELKRMKAIVLGDIGCYTLGALAPLTTLESAIDMGASVSMGHGFEVARELESKAGVSQPTSNRPVFSIIGDSTFAHSGLSGVVSTVYNAGVGNIVILDNRTTAMTGGQGNPISGKTLQGRQTNELDLPKVLKAIGVEDVVQVDAHNVKAVREALKAAANNKDKLSVVICQAPCVVEYRIHNTVRVVDAEACRGCGTCTRIGCPAISMYDTNIAEINDKLCNECSQCEQYCPFNAIHSKEGE